MRVLVTGAKGFIGKNLCESLKNIRDGKDRRERYRPLLPLEVFEFDADASPRQLEEWCASCDFVFHLAGVNRPRESESYQAGNVGTTQTLLDLLERHGNACPVMLSSSVQASLSGRFAGSEYGKSKLASEELCRRHAIRTGAKVLIYRFPNVYGKWCRPNYNSVVATFCHNVARGLPIRVDDPSVELELLYVDDLVAEMLEALLGGERQMGDGLCEARPTDHVSVGELAGLVWSFAQQRVALGVEGLEAGSLHKKLYSTYMSYLDPFECSYSLNPNVDERGSFTEFVRTADCGQVSINVSKPGVVKGQHWHHSKWEKFLVVSGEALIRLRRVGADEGGRPFPVAEYRVCGEEPTVVEMLPGYTHSIQNTSTTRDLVTVMWANEAFDPQAPDTYFEEV